MLINFDHLKTTYNALVHKLKTLRGNWEQNDPAADDYIKNRTHYSEGIKEVTVLHYEVDTDAGITPRAFAGPEIYSVYFDATDLQSFVVGQQYSVKWNNASYTCVAKMVDGLPVLGDVGLIDGYEDTGESFLIAINPQEGFGIILTTKAGKYPVTVTTRQEVVHKLDKKFIDLPDNLVTSDELADVAKSGSYYDLMDTPTVYTDIVRYNSTQNLTTNQKSIARSNIGAGTSNFSGSYDDLANKTHYRRTTTLVMPYQHETLHNGRIAGSGVDYSVFHESGMLYAPFIADGTKDAVKSASIHHIRMNGIDYAYRGSVTYVNITGAAANHDETECTATMHVFGNASLIAKYIDDINNDVKSMSGYEQFDDTGENLCYMLGVFDYYPRNTYLENDVLYRMTINDTDATISLPVNSTGYIYEYEALDEAYIPLAIARVGDSYTKSESDAKYASSWNDLTDKPFGEVTETIEPITWDGNTEGLVEYNMLDATFYKVSDKAFSNEQIKAMSASVYNAWDDQGDSGSEVFSVDFGEVWDEMVQEDCITDDYALLIPAEIVVIRKNDLVLLPNGEKLPDIGTYFRKHEEKDENYYYLAYPTSFPSDAITETTIKKLDEKYLPESVDGVVIRSSTADSTKKFKLTVDDGGTISAVEIGGR